MENFEIIGDKYIIKLVADTIDVNDAILAVNDCECGAVSLFMGNTRRTETGDQTGQQSVVSLDYEAYHSMALKEMQKIVEQNMSDYKNNQIRKCYVVHRLGRVCVGQTSILIACSAPHRTEAHQMVINLLNDIKEKVPIWKKINYNTSGHTEDSNDQNIRQNNSEWSLKSEAFWLKNTSN